MNRQLLCVFLLISAFACRGLDRRAFDDVERASKAVQAGIEGKAGLPQYGALLGGYTAALSAVRPRMTSSRERAVLAEYDAALKGLTDIQLVWEEKDARGSVMLPIHDQLPARIAREYDLAVNTNEPPSIYADEALSAIWVATKGHLEKATRLLAG